MNVFCPHFGGLRSLFQGNMTLGVDMAILKQLLGLWITATSICDKSETNSVCARGLYPISLRIPFDGPNSMGKLLADKVELTPTNTTQLIGLLPLWSFNFSQMKTVLFENQVQTEFVQILSQILIIVIQKS